MCKEILAVVALYPLAAFGQGTFQNLGFENPIFIATNVIGVPGEVQFQPAFAGWTGYIGTNYAPIAFSNSLSAGGRSYFAILGPGNPFGLRLNGNYTAVLQAGGTELAADITLAQTGLVPVYAQSLYFLASCQSAFFVRINGQQLSLVPQQGIEFAADISAYSGQTVELSFMLPNVLGPGAQLYLDAISFSPNPIPEPSFLALSVIGGCLLFWIVRKRASAWVA